MRTPIAATESDKTNSASLNAGKRVPSWMIWWLVVLTLAVLSQSRLGAKIFAYIDDPPEQLRWGMRPQLGDWVAIKVNTMIPQMIYNHDQPMVAMVHWNQKFFRIEACHRPSADRKQVASVIQAIRAEIQDYLSAIEIDRDAIEIIADIEVLP